MNAYVDAMRRYFDFKGRSSRYEFWMFTLVVFMGGVIALILTQPSATSRAAHPSSLPSG